jgi:hypothetical protein
MTRHKMKYKGKTVVITSDNHRAKLAREPKYARNRQARRTEKAMDRLAPSRDKKFKCINQKIKERENRQKNIQARIEKRKNGKSK